MSVKYKKTQKNLTKTRVHAGAAVAYSSSSRMMNSGYSHVHSTTGGADSVGGIGGVERDSCAGYKSQAIMMRCGGVIDLAGQRHSTSGDRAYSPGR
jgi:hypothetical protein